MLYFRTTGCAGSGKARRCLTKLRGNVRGSFLNVQRRLRGKQKLALLVVGIIVICILMLAYYDSEGRKAQALNSVAVAVSMPLTGPQIQALQEQFNRYDPEDGRVPVTLTVYVLEEPGLSEKIRSAADAMNAGFPNLYFMDEKARDYLDGLVPLEPLEQRYPGDPAVTNGIYYALDKKQFMDFPALKELPSCYLAIQRSDTYAVTKDAQTQYYYAYQSELLDHIAANEPVLP